MKILNKKVMKITAKLLKDQSGISIVLVIFVMLVMSAIGYSMTSMMSAKQKSVPVTAESSRAFSIAEGGIQWAGKYLSELIDWDSTVDRTDIILGGGKFDVAFSSRSEDATYEYITATCTGKHGNGKRVISMQFKREKGLGCA